MAEKELPGPEERRAAILELLSRESSIRVAQLARVDRKSTRLNSSH